MTLQEFDAALKERCDHVYELAAPKGVQEYVVWHEYGKQFSHADDHNEVGLPKVQVEIFSQQRNSVLSETVHAALFALYIPFAVISDGYDPEYTAFRTILQLVVV